MARWASDDDDRVDVPVPEVDDTPVDYTGVRLARDLTGADWRDVSGDHRWRSLDPTWQPTEPLKQEWR